MKNNLSWSRNRKTGKSLFHNDQFLPIGTPENRSKRSSPIITSSIRLQEPSLTNSGESNVDTISPPIKTK